MFDQGTYIKGLGHFPPQNGGVHFAERLLASTWAFCTHAIVITARQLHILKFCARGAVVEGQGRAHGRGPEAPMLFRRNPPSARQVPRTLLVRGPGLLGHIRPCSALAMIIDERVVHAVWLWTPSRALRGALGARGGLGVRPPNHFKLLAKRP